MAFTPTVAGTYTVALTATDSHGDKGSTSATLAAANFTVAAGGPYQSISAAAVAFTATITGPETGALTYSWNFGDGSTSTLAGPSHAYATPGSYNVTLSVKDAAGQTATAATTANVYAPVQPQITGLPALHEVGTKVTLGSQVTGGVPGTDTESWTVSENGTTVTTGSGSSLAFTPTVAGTYTIALTATDSAGNKGSTSATLAAANLTVAAGGPYQSISAAAVTFIATVSGPETGALTYSWNFGDGSTSTLAGPSHAYATPGSYNVTLSVKDAAGQTATAATTANVYAPVQPQITGLPALARGGDQGHARRAGHWRCPRRRHRKLDCFRERHNSHHRIRILVGLHPHSRRDLHHRPDSD